MNLLVTGAWSSAKDNIQALKAMGHEVIFMQWEIDALPCDYSWVEGTICNGLFLSHPIEKFINLRFIQLTSVGLDRVPIEYILSHKITIKNARGVYSIPMAEFVIAGVLELYKQLNLFNEQKTKHIWNKLRNLKELYLKTVCILGCGSVGGECAKRFKAFDCKVLGVDTEKKDIPYFDDVYSVNDVDKIIKLADIIVITLPLTADTYHMFDKEMLLRLKKDCMIVNVSRGSIIDTKALVECIDKLGGVLLDVFEDEPLDIASELWDISKIKIFPHNSFVGEYNSERLSKVIIDNLK